MERKRVTIKDIAGKLHVSAATVSRALSDHPDISEQTKSLILETARDMGYHPNLLASGLIKRKTRTIGVIVPTINRPFWSNTISGIEKAAHQAGYKVMICQSNEQFEREKENIELLANSMVDGLLIAISKETTGSAHIEEVLDRGIPVLMFERVIDELPVSKVRTDDYAGALELTEHLIKNGYRRIAHMTGPSTLRVCELRVQGYKAALEQYGIPFDPGLVLESDFTREAAQAATRKLYARVSRDSPTADSRAPVYGSSVLPQGVTGSLPPDAIFCFADIIAIGVMLEIKAMGLKIPEEVAIAGFGNDDVTALTYPSLTTMQQSSFDIGRRSAEILIEELSNPGAVLQETEIIKPGLIVRASTVK